VARWRQVATLPTRARRTIYVVPLGDYDAHPGRPDLDKVFDYLRAWFAPLEVRLLAPTDRARSLEGVRSRPYGKVQQRHCSDIFKLLKAIRPPDAMTLLGVTMEDLYPSDDWSYVFGKAMLSSRVGVFSYARLEPRFSQRVTPLPEWFPDGEVPPGPDTARNQVLHLLRAAKLTSHELVHTLGVKHCVYFRCRMNGCNSLEESDASPAHLCPVCLRKLHLALDFDPAEMYRRTLGVLDGWVEALGDTHGDLEEERAWLRRRGATLAKHAGKAPLGRPTASSRSLWVDLDAAAEGGGAGARGAAAGPGPAGAGGKANSQGSTSGAGSESGDGRSLENDAAPAAARPAGAARGPRRSAARPRIEPRTTAKQLARNNSVRARMVADSARAMSRLVADYAALEE